MTPIAARGAPSELAAGRLTPTPAPTGHGRDPGTTLAAAIAIGALLAVALAALRAARASEDAVTHP
jgi:hypothetical protein